MLKGADPIQTPAMIKKIGETILEFHGELYFDIFNVGINVGLRGHNLLDLKFEDIDFENRSVTVLEKNKKWREVRLNEKVMSIFYRRRDKYKDYVYIFESRKSNNHKVGKPISIWALNDVLNAVGKEHGLKLTSHSLRKTFGCALYRSGKPIELISMIFNHATVAQTLVYIGLTKGQVMQAYDELIV